jgi:hypothetical protein
VSLKVHALRFADIVTIYRMEAPRNGQPFGRAIEPATPITAARYLYASNAEIVLKRKTGEVVRIYLYPESDDSKLPSLAGSTGSTYEEHVVDSEGGEHSLVVLKKVSKSGHLVKWSKKDGFARGRFNPDLVETSAVTAFSRKVRKAGCVKEERTKR